MRQSGRINLLNVNPDAGVGGGSGEDARGPAPLPLALPPKTTDPILVSIYDKVHLLDQF